MPRLHDTPLMREIAERAAAVVRETVDSSSPRLGGFTRPFTMSEEYVSECLLAAGELAVACDQMDFAITYLSGYRKRRTSIGDLITRSDYLAYQLENLYLRIGMLLDRSLKLTNTVFRLGTPPRDCRLSVIADNDYVRSTSVRSSLKAINKAVQPFAQVRNSIAHHSRYKDSGLNEVEMFYILEKENHAHPDPLVEQMRFMFKAETDRYVEERRSELAPAVEELIELEGQLFDALLPEFLKRAG